MNLKLKVEIDHSISLGAILLGGLVAAGIVWVVKQSQQHKPVAVVEAWMMVAPSRSAITN